MTFGVMLLLSEQLLRHSIEFDWIFSSAYRRRWSRILLGQLLQSLSMDALVDPVLLFPWTWHPSIILIFSSNIAQALNATIPKWCCPPLYENTSCLINNINWNDDQRARVRNMQKQSCRLVQSLRMWYHTIIVLWVVWTSNQKAT